MKRRMLKTLEPGVVRAPDDRAETRREPGPQPLPSGGRIRVAVVEDDDWLREHLMADIGRAADLVCVNSYASGEAALKGLPADSPHVVLMDIGLPGMDGVGCVRELKTILPSLQVLMLTVYAESERVFAALLAGADGYLLKRTATEELLEAIRKVHRGESPMDWRIARQVVRYFGQMGKPAPGVEALTVREREVLGLLAKGASYKEIADQLSIAPGTLISHIKNIYQKLHVHSRGEAAAVYFRR